MTIVTDKIFAQLVAKGYTTFRPNSKYPQGAAVIRSVPGKLLFSNGRVVISSSMAAAEREV